MNGYIAPSEIPGVTSEEMKIFGYTAEFLIYKDYCTKFSYTFRESYIDKSNPSEYLAFLKTHNPLLKINAFSVVLEHASLGEKRPDILIHAFTEKVYYEIKPDSRSGRSKGINKLGILSATYKYFDLPYVLGCSYKGCEIIVAYFEEQLKIKLKARLKGPGLLVYYLWLECKIAMDLITLSTILRFVIKKMNEHVIERSFKPIDLELVFTKRDQLSYLENALRLL